MGVRCLGPLAAAVVAMLTLAGGARAAELAVSGADACLDAQTIADDVADLLGRPLASVTGVDFEVTLARGPAPEWKLRLDTIDAADAGHERRSRELTADSCAELTDAAAVAIAMTVRARPPAPAPTPSSSPPPSALPTVVTGPPASPAAPVTLAGGLAVVGDGGALPDPGIGVELGASLRHRWLRATVAGTLFASQVTRATGTTGGDFRLMFVSAQACFTQPVRRTLLLACAGYELGRLSAEGVGVFGPQLGSARWQAPRAELGLSIPVASRVALVARGGVAVPLSRTQFVIEGATPVHRPGSVAVRLALGAELEF